MEPIREAYHRYLRYFLSKDDSTATAHDRFLALAYAVRSEMVDRWIRTQEHYHHNNARRVYYISPEYILGKSLHQNVISLGLLPQVRATADELGFSLDEVLQIEDDLDLGNGAKGRQAACIQESMASTGYAGMGYGLRYDYGLFRQKIVDGKQVEVPYDWQNREHPWEIPRPEYQCTVQFGGVSVAKGAGDKTSAHNWQKTQDVIALPSDIPIPGHGCPTVNTLRLWSSRPAEEFPAEYTRHGDYVKACDEMAEAGRITRVLHPDSDVLRSTPARIRLQYFLVSTSLQDIVRRYKVGNGSLSGFEDQVAIHLSGSNCALAVPELMHLLVDIEEVPWARAWEIVRKVFTYTSNAVAFEQLEGWPVYMLEQLLPRHMEIIYELNQAHLDVCRSRGFTDVETVRDISVIEEGEVKRVKLSHLALLAATGVNGVSLAQVQRLGGRVFPRMISVLERPLHAISSGESHRRWLLGQNEPLAQLLTEAIGDGWVHDPEQLARIEPLVSDAGFLDRLAYVKLLAKRRLLASLREVHGVEHDESALFDVQATRIHPSRRQMLHVLGLVSRYLRIKAGASVAHHELHIFSGKAMPSDFLAKQTVKLIHAVADAINGDADMHGRLRVLFVPDFTLSWADRLVPAIDLVEVLSAPGFESSTTTPLKGAFAAAVALIARGGAADDFIGKVGEENVFAFGGGEWGDNGGYRPSGVIAQDAHLHEVLSWIEHLCAQITDDDVFPLISSVRDSDRFHVVADFADYCAQHDRACSTYADRPAWLSIAARTLARSGALSSDRTVREYARTMWKLEPSGL